MDTSGILYHYTDARGLHGIIQSKQIWATSYRFMSDAREFEYGFDLISKVYPSVDISDPRSLPPDFAEKLQESNFAELIRNWKKVYNFDGLFLASFSADGDSLGQWRGYAGLHSGYSLGFSSSDLISIDSETHLVICCYNEEQQKTELKTLIDRYLPAAKTIMRLRPMTPLICWPSQQRPPKKYPCFVQDLSIRLLKTKKNYALQLGQFGQIMNVFAIVLVNE